MGKGDADHDLVQSLFKLQKKSPNFVRSTVYDAPEDPEIHVRSWRMSEHHYYKVPSPFPTLARGIFTVWVPNGRSKEEGEGTGVYRIVARGYDKFFNIGEVPWTTWDALERHTKPPYTLTLKSNGCIIFVAALNAEKLLVTSKHSIGNIEGQKISHSQAGDAWLNKHLQSVGKSRSDLAKVLFENNWTAVAELCDDSFEEHVLAYSTENTGLHLHGLNKSSAAFDTLPSSSTSEDLVTVDSFAKQWGFIQTRNFDLNSVKEVKDFADSCGETGTWDGEPVEGFVVRTRVRSDPATKTNVDPNTEHSDKQPRSGRSDAPPYPPESSFFFKVKFDEPYMMYRDWREITKSYLSAFSRGGPSSLINSKASKHRLKRPETRVYDSWIRKKIREDPKLFSEYQRNKGIVSTRQIFLDWLETPQGTEQLARERDSTERSPPPTKEQSADEKVIIAPVAIPGCGKTTVAVALTKLFGFSHTQSDDVAKGKKTAAIFESNVLKKLLLGNNNVVIADKNNHLRQHRTALKRLMPKSPPVRVVALHWAIPENEKAIVHKICAERIARRGDNHQTLRANEETGKLHEEVLWQFINSSNELTSDEVDDIIEMDINDDTETSLRKAVNGLCKILKLETPSESSIREAVQAATDYAVPSESKRTIAGTSTKISSQKKEKKKGTPRYFGIVPLKNEWNIEEIVSPTLSTLEGDAKYNELRKTWDAIRSRKGVNPLPHITLVHQASLKSGSEGDAQRLWDTCKESQDDDEFEFRLSHLLYNSRIMALSLEPTSLSPSRNSDSKVLKALSPLVQRRLHITVGLTGSQVKPIEAGELVSKWRDQGLSQENEGAVPLPHSGGTLFGKVEGLWS